MDGINSWWEKRTGERFWLGVPRHDGDDEVLATPCNSGHGSASADHPLIRYVRDGDAVFHFDMTRQAIVAWSAARGRVLKRPLAWSRTGCAWDAGKTWTESLPSWTVDLEPAVTIADVVSLDHIARLQYELFPALRTLEDTVGESLHYPFSLGSPVETHLLAGRVFKLPALFVAACSPLARAAGLSRNGTAMAGA